MAYDPRRDKCLKSFGTWEIGGREYEITLQQYDGGVPKIAITQVSFSAKGKEYRNRINGIPLDLIPIFIEHEILSSTESYCAEALETLPLNAVEK